MKPYYQDEWVTIYHGDCREILPSLDKVDLVLTDPPYEDESLIETVNMIMPLEQGGVLIWFSKFPHTGRVQTITERYYPFISEYQWFYPDATGYRAKHMPLLKHQTILVFGNKWAVNLENIRQPSKAPRNYDVAMYKTSKLRKSPSAEYYWKPHPQGDWIESVLIINKVQEQDFTKSPIGAKPEELICLLLNGYSAKNELILDPFLGSGTTAYCAKKLNRHCIGIEIEEKYCEIAAKRCSQSVMALNV